MNKLINSDVNNISTLKQLIDSVAGLYHESSAVIIRIHDTIRVISYTQLHSDIRKVAHSLQAFGAVGKNVAIIGSLCYEWVVSFLGVVYSGNTAVIIDNELSTDDLSEQFFRTDTEIVFFDQSCAGKVFFLKDKLNLETVFCFEKNENSESVGSILEYEISTETEPQIDVCPDTTAVLVFTSGTMGASKVVKLTNRNICDNVFCCSNFLRDAVKPGDRNIPILPPHHLFCLTANILTGLYFGVTLCFGGGLKNIAFNLKHFNPSIIIAVPMIVSGMYKRIWIEAKKSGKDRVLKRAIGLSNILRKINIDLRRFLFKDILSCFGGELKTIICGGAFLDPELVGKYDELGISLRNGYGITECSPVVACNLNKNNNPKSVGRAAQNHFCEIKIIDNEICVRGSVVMIEYYKDTVTTEEAFVSGYFKTGDLGYIDSDGYLYITGRKKNLIILQDGNNISPEELEMRFDNIQLIKSIMISAMESAGGIMITANIFPDHTYAVNHNIDDVYKALEEYVSSVNATLPSYKRIKQIVIAETDFQKTALGKIKRYMDS